MTSSYLTGSNIIFDIYAQVMIKAKIYKAKEIQKSPCAKNILFNHLQRFIKANIVRMY